MAVGTSNAAGSRHMGERAGFQNTYGGCRKQNGCRHRLPGVSCLSLGFLRAVCLARVPENPQGTTIRTNGKWL
eukprot:7734675-Pyramimonas_sp.AAC.1